jgi:hypothetical protein
VIEFSIRHVAATSAIRALELAPAQRNPAQVRDQAHLGDNRRTVGELSLALDPIPTGWSFEIGLGPEASSRVEG